MDINFLDRPAGRIAYSMAGEGPLLIAVPGLGDLRSSYEELSAALVAQGYRVAVMDLRGHGDSDVSFHEHGDVATAEDVLALAEKLGAPAVVLGNSLGGAVAVWAAGERPDLILGMVLYSPFLRNPKLPAFITGVVKFLYRLAFVRPWGAALWAMYYRSLNKGTPPADLDEHLAEIKASLRQPGRLRSLRQLLLQLDHRVIDDRLPTLKVPIRVFVGAVDPDFPDPSAESGWITHNGAHSELVPEAGHYPHRQRPDLVIPKTIEFLDGLRQGKTWKSNA